MKDYTFDLTLKTSITVSAESQEEAERIVSEPLDAAFILIYEQDPHEDIEDYELEGEASLVGSVDLVQIDGEDV